MSGQTLPLPESAVRPAPFRPLADRWFALRNRLLSSPAFQRWAIRFPLTRPIANNRAAALFDLTAGFVYSQVLAACVRLNLFAILADGPLSVAVLADRLSIPHLACFRPPPGCAWPNTAATGVMAWACWGRR